MASSYMTRIFGNSPFMPMQTHMEKVIECVEEIIPFVDAALEQNEKAVQLHRAKIVLLETEADDLKHELRSQLPDSLFMPVSRRDLLEVLTMQDKLANRSKDVSGIIVSRKMQLPEEIKEEYKVFVQRCVDACKQAYLAILELDELVEAGFKGREVILVEKLLDRLGVIESETDEMEAGLRAKLMKLEDVTHPVQMMFMYKLLEKTGDLANFAERVGSRLQLMLAR
jgi:predicted phosphate transport protein (TIGR00153 family)